MLGIARRERLTLIDGGNLDVVDEQIDRDARIGRAAVADGVRIDSRQDGVVVCCKQYRARAAGDDQAVIVEVKRQEIDVVDIDRIDRAAVNRPACFKADDGSRREAVELDDLLRMRIVESCRLDVTRQEVCGSERLRERHFDIAVREYDQIIAAAAVDCIAVSRQNHIALIGTDDRLVV